MGTSVVYAGRISGAAIATALGQLGLHSGAVIIPAANGMEVVVIKYSP